MTLHLSLYAVTAVCVLGLLVSRALVQKAQLDRRNKHNAFYPPSPKQRLPLPYGLGRLIDMVISVYRHQELDKQVEAVQTYGSTISLSTLNRSFYATADPQNARAVVATSFTNYDKGPQFIKAFSRFLGSGIFVSDGEQWKSHRAMTKPFFAKEKMGGDDIGIRLFEPYVSKLLANLRAGALEAVNVQEAFSRYTMDVAGRFLFGTEIRCLDQTVPAPFAESFANGQDFVQWLLRLGPLASLFLNEKKYTHDRDVVKSFIDEIVKSAMSRRKAMGKDAPKFNSSLFTETENSAAVSGPPGETVKSSEDYSETLLDHMLDMTEDENLIRDEILNILLAGRDTTASLLSSIMCLLAKSPTLYQRARQEVMEIAPLDTAPTMSEIRRLPLMKNIIRETLRLRPPVPTDVREAVEDAVLPGGNFFIPKGTAVFVFIYAMHRLKEYWGNDAHIFRPDRWEDDKQTTKDAILKGAYMPFWSGPRICLGQQFALNEASYTLFRILQTFESIDLALDKKGWQTRDGPMLYSNITLQYVGGLWMRLKPSQ